MDKSLHRLKMLSCFILTLTALCCVLRTSPAAATDSERLEKASTAANSWLKMVDKSDYAASWKNSASLFKNAVSQQQWEKQMKAFRSPLGATKSRELLGQKYLTTLPGAPDGEYVVIQYKSSFENKASAIETVTPMKDRDGAWRVSGYYVK